MSQKPPLTDEEIHAKLHEAWLTFMNQRGETDFGNNVILTVRRVLMTLQMSLMMKAEGVTAPDEISVPPSHDQP